MAEATKQQTRKERLQGLADDYHRSRYGDYDDMYEGFATRYGLTWDEDVEVNENEGEPIPRFASLSTDETYGNIDVFETLAEAVADQAKIPFNGETLNCPAGVIDLDTGKRVSYKLVGLSEDAYSILCGLVQDTKTLEERELDTDSIQGQAESWKELRNLFPFDDYHGHDDL